MSVLLVPAAHSSIIWFCVDMCTYAVIKREPSAGDVFPECRKEYETTYLNPGNELHTTWVDERNTMLEFNSGERTLMRRLS